MKIGPKIVRHARSITFQMAEVMMPRELIQQKLDAIVVPRPLLHGSMLKGVSTLGHSLVINRPASRCRLRG